MKGAIIVSLLCNIKNTEYLKQRNKNYEKCFIVLLHFVIRDLSLASHLLLDTAQNTPTGRQGLSLRCAQKCNGKIQLQ